MENEKLKAIGAILHKLRAENERLREENARLRGQLTEEHRRIDKEDREAFDLVHHRAPDSGLYTRVVMEV